MKKRKKVSRQKRTILFLIAVVLLFVILATVILFCVKQILEKNTPEENDDGTSAVYEEETLGSVMTEGIEILTPIGELYYSQAWEEYAEVQYSSNEQSFTAVIQATIGEYKADILAIHLGDEGEGTIIGSVPDLDGNQTMVYLELYEINADNSWSQSEMNIFYAMQEGVNQIIEQITQLYGYVPV